MALAEDSFDAIWPWYLDLSSTTEPSFVSCRSLQCCSLQEMRGKLKVWRGLFHTHLQGRTGGWDAFNKLLFWLQKEAAYLFTFGEGWYHLVRAALWDRDIHSHRTWSLKDLSRDRRETPQGVLCLSYLGLVFHLSVYVFLYDRVKVLSHQ